MSCNSMVFSVVFSDFSQFFSNTRFLSKFQLDRINKQNRWRYGKTKTICYIQNFITDKMSCNSLGFSVVFSDFSQFPSNTLFLSKFQLDRINIRNRWRYGKTKTICYIQNLIRIRMSCNSMGFSVVFSDFSQFPSNTWFLVKISAWSDK